MKWESEGLIINALFEGDKRFNQLKKYTELSNPVLAKRLKELEKQERINAIPDSKTKRFFYSLNHTKINSLDEKRKKQKFKQEKN